MMSLVKAAVERLNARTRAAMPDLNEEVGVRQEVSREQVRLATSGLDIDMSTLRRVSGPCALSTWQSMEPALAAERGEAAGEMLVSALEQMFVLGALHEQIRAERERGA